MLTSTSTGKDITTSTFYSITTITTLIAICIWMAIQLSFTLNSTLRTSIRSPLLLTRIRIQDRLDLVQTSTLNSTAVTIISSTAGNYSSAARKLTSLRVVTLTGVFL
uniref:Uncharacterized protein n=1 Tax=Picea glauca TaxID=3330 RepID=A0A117NIJ7_PICGL|nr:hypothetical protein ABT39_MTgene3303 [Picea glauca]QHR89177.1 hypothetical protein Q903MT_gene3197 [Picea sitchensis]